LGGEPYVLGVDVGGTKVADGLDTPDGKVLENARAAMKVDGSAEEALQCVFNAIEQVFERSNGRRATSIGIASPGPLDPIRGVVLLAPNLPCWREFPLRDAIQDHYRIPTRLDNDANAAGLAEAAWGAGAGHRSVLYITIGTGIGTAIILNQHVYYGRTGAAGEGGHMTIDHRGEVRCGCGKHGCIEGLAAGPAIAALAKERLKQDPEQGGSLLRAINQSAGSVTEVIVNAAARREPIAEEIVQQVIEYLGIWIGSMIDLLEPDIIVVGGGVGARLAGWFDHLSECAAKWSINPRAREIRIVPAHYGADSGLAGSAALWYCQDKSASEAVRHPS
jgi:glucokinase